MSHSPRYTSLARHALAFARRAAPGETAAILTGTLAMLAAAASLNVLTPGVLTAQAAATPINPTTYVGRAASVADRASANVARAEAVVTEGSSMRAPEAVPAPDADAGSPAGATAADSAPSARGPASASPAPEGERAPARAGEKSAPLLSFDREIYSYSAEGRRDPFKSLMATGDLRPLISDLRLVAVAFDPDGASVAILRDTGTNEQYRVRAGQQLGRMRVAAIQSRKVVFTIEEFGFSRQESLALGDPNNARTQR